MWCVGFVANLLAYLQEMATLDTAELEESYPFANVEHELEEKKLVLENCQLPLL